MKLPLLCSLVALVAPVTLVAQTSAAPWLRQPEEIRRTLDSLAAASIGPYVHFVVGSCLGGRCEARVSLHTDDIEAPFRYRAATWVGTAAKPQFYAVNRELPEEEAGMLLADARMSGIMSLVADSSSADPRLPRFWLRARFGTQTVVINGASLGAPTYVASVEGGAGSIYDRVEKALLALVRRQFAERSADR